MNSNCQCGSVTEWPSSETNELFGETTYTGHYEFSADVLHVRLYFAGDIQLVAVEGYTL